VGAIDDFSNALGKGCGRVIITNINGVKDLDAIGRMSEDIDLEQSLARVILD